MNREAALLQWHRNTLNGSLSEIDILVQKPAKYLDPDLSIEPSTGEYLYERVAKLREHLMVDFPSVSAHIPAMNYKLPDDPGGSLNRDDLRQLRADVLTVLQIVSNLTTITR